MQDVHKLNQPMTLTGFILFFLGLVTMTPEIYFSGIFVMFLSASLQIKDLEKHRIEQQGLDDTSFVPTYAS
jgi:flagellar biosynthesis component FlhA